ncbi:hypothetical protein FGO68_gene9649 [Halteria grandinella]|uniref:Uncharacterized protein n=1 Tax=Halteria grandinella TaxID=5974 RepID=A0A8J8NBZ9_HALGN|nr:hypothetical protein FGO68_gene9649 [Halteria grandinella]
MPDDSRIHDLDSTLPLDKIYTIAKKRKRELSSTTKQSISTNSTFLNKFDRKLNSKSKSSEIQQKDLIQHRDRSQSQVVIHQKPSITQRVVQKHVKTFLNKELPIIPDVTEAEDNFEKASSKDRVSRRKEVSPPTKQTTRRSSRVFQNDNEVMKFDGGLFKRQQEEQQVNDCYTPHMGGQTWGRKGSLQKINATFNFQYVAAQEPSRVYIQKPPPPAYHQRETSSRDDSSFSISKEEEEESSSSYTSESQQPQRHRIAVRPQSAWKKPVARRII